MEIISDMPERLVALVKEYEQMTPRERLTNGRNVLQCICTAGRTAAFFDGYRGMKRLHDAAEKLVGNDNSVGYWLNRLWDGIGDWLA